MIGAIVGDVIGSVFERAPIKFEEFVIPWDRAQFTDDTVLTVAVAHALLRGEDYGLNIRAFGLRYPRAGYGGGFRKWLQEADRQPYNSWGNGSAMRVSPVGFAFDTAEDVLTEAAKSAAVTHNHPEGIKGAQATALAIFMARSGSAPGEIRDSLQTRFGYNLGRRLMDIRPGYRPDVSCQGSVPEAIIAFLESGSVEDAVRKAISLGGDSDTQACIAGAIAHARFKTVRPDLWDEVRKLLPREFLDIIQEFSERYPI